MNSLGPVNDTFCSEKVSKKGSIWPKNSENAKKRGLRVRNLNSRGHTTKRGFKVPHPDSRGHTTKRGLRVPKPNTRG